jgi:hypothetical protein
MFSRGVLLGLLFFFLTNHIVPTDEIELLPEVDNDEQLFEQGSTITLTCIQRLENVTADPFKLKWIVPLHTFKRSAGEMMVTTTLIIIFDLVITLSEGVFCIIILSGIGETL